MKKVKSMKDSEESLLILDDRFAYVQKQHSLKESKIGYLKQYGRADQCLRFIGSEMEGKGT